MQWLAGEIGVPKEQIQIFIFNAFAYSTSIHPCQACARLNNASAILAGGTQLAALAQVVNEFIEPGAPISPEQMASIASAIANPEEGTQYAAAGEWLDALTEYVAILNTELGFSTADAVEFAGKYTTPITEGDNAELAAYVAMRLAALGG